MKENGQRERTLGRKRDSMDGSECEDRRNEKIKKKKGEYIKRKK